MNKMLLQCGVRMLFVMLPVLSVFFGQAQSDAIFKIAENCSTADLRKNLYYLADGKLEGRMMGSHGDTLAAMFVSDWFKKHGVAAPYQNGKSYLQAITAEKKIEISNLQIAGSEHQLFDGWSIYPHLPIQLKDVPIVYPGPGSLSGVVAKGTDADFKVKALLLDGSVMLKAIRDGSIDSLEMILQKKGVVAILFADTAIRKLIASGKQRAFLPNYVVDLPGEMPSGVMLEISLTPNMLNLFLGDDSTMTDQNGYFTDTTDQNFKVLGNKLSVNLAEKYEKEYAPNVIGVILGSDTSLPAVVVGAHRDHDGVNGKDVYYGAVDNASGTVAIMQMAAMINQAIKKGNRPKRTIVFASFTGEERGLLGSGWYVKHPLHTMDRTYAMMNLDMLGRVDTLYSGRKSDSNYVYFQVSDSLNHGLNEAMLSASARLPALKLDPHFQEARYRQRMLKGSDHYNFFLRGIPVIGFNCGFAVDYHKPTDTPDKINYNLLKQQTQLAFLTLWNLVADR